MPGDGLPDIPGNGNVLIARMIWRDKYFHTFSCYHYYENTNAVLPNQEQLDTGAETLFTAWSGEFDDIMDHESFFNTVTLRYLNNEGVDLTAISSSDPVSGDLGDIAEDAGLEIESLPPECSLVIRKITGKQGRSNRGRMFIPCISEAIQHDGIIDILNYAGVKDVLAMLFEQVTIGGTTFAPCHWNRKENSLVPIARLAANQFLRTRRDRRWKEGDLLITNG